MSRAVSPGSRPGTGSDTGAAMGDETPATRGRAPLRWLRRMPAMTLRRRLVIAFVALVAVAIGLVGGISYSATVSAFNAEVNGALMSAAATLAAGGGFPTGAPGAELHSPDDHHDADDPAVSLAQRIDPGGAVTVLRGPAQALSVNDTQRQLAASPRAGIGRFDVRVSGGERYRIYTLALGQGRGAVVVGRNLADAVRVLARVAVNTVLIGIGVMVLAGLVGWWIARQITRRLATLSDAAETVALTGDLAVPIASTGKDEVARLATSMRTMLAELGQSRDAQRRLVEDAGHELRTPITSLRTNARVMRRYEQLSDADRQRLLDDVDGELQELTALVNELVELATDTYSGEPAQRTVLAQPVEKVAERVRRRSGREITVTADESQRIVQRGAVERAVGNLLENAVKFDAGNAAPIEVDVTDGVIRVSDRGPGVPADELAAIFDRFHRSDTSRSLPGSGLGLAIVRDVAVRHGGTVAAAARPGGGLVVTLTLHDHVSPNSEVLRDRR